MIGLVDCNNFYVSCERVFNPKLNRRAVGIMSNNDGCIVARSNELKALGVEMGTPAHHVRHLVDRGEVILYSSNYELYGDMSHRVQGILEQETAGVEPYSIDEMFVHMDGFTPKGLQEHATSLRQKIGQYTGIPVCVGVAATHTLAKLANRIAKKHPGYPGVCILHAESDEARHLLQQIDVGDVWGIGRRLNERLQILGIKTAWDLREADTKRLRRKFSVNMERTVLELRGISCLEMNDLHEPKQRIMTSRSFGRPTQHLYDLQGAIRQHAQRGAEKLRQQNSLARAVLVFLKTDRFRPDLPQYSPSLVAELERPSQDTRDILHAAQEALTKIYRPKYGYKKAGVMMLDLTDTNRQQLSLMDTPQTEEERQRSEKLMATMDALNEKMGKGTVRLGLPEKNAPWHLRCAHRSPRYTTNWDELMRAYTDEGIARRDNKSKTSINYTPTRY
ncbi:Y-family DNA polymerase [Halomonas sp. CUBES01]|uniref:Y-family DNA polymerase n=1 Tax=Halomonas sp. CUBES01 TaxID=2897340 RepID=UPI001E374B95|nr:Y-family DNA polymerase [Halomonas sp. CUBES01]MEC4767917.1 Y-family DNA polymerase [Halomonas sp. CUBES01]